MSRIIDLAERVFLYALLVPVVSILAHTGLVRFGAPADNVVVTNVKWVAEGFIWDPLETVFAGQTPVHTALLALVFYGVVAFVVAWVCKALRPASPERPTASRVSRFS